MKRYRVILCEGNIYAQKRVVLFGRHIGWLTLRDINGQYITFGSVESALSHIEHSKIKVLAEVNA